MASNNDLPQCQLCQELYMDPLLLPCLHSFCKKCLVSEREQQGSSEGGKLKCPSCQEYCEVPSGGVTGFIQNINLARKVEVAKIEEKMKSKENIPCDRCIKRQNAFAVSFCYDCLEFLCNACKEDHEYSRHTMKHEVIDIESKQAMTEIANKCEQITSKPLYCAQHEEEKLKFYCEQCNTLTCRDCILMDHVGHSMKPQNTVAEESREEIKKNAGTITTEMIGSLDDVITQGETMIERIKNHQGEVEREINTSFDAVIEAVENRRKTLLTEATSIANGKICAVKEQLDGCRKMRKDMVHVEKFAQDVSENHSPTEVLSSKELINTRIQQVNKRYRETALEIKENDVMYAAIGNRTLTKYVGTFGLVSADLSRLTFEIESGMTITTATINEERKVSISLHDTKGSNPIPFHSLCTLPIISTLKDPNGQESNVPHSIDQESGIVWFSFTPKVIGEHFFSIKINGSHINKSPYRLMAYRNYATLTNERSFDSGHGFAGVAVHNNGDVYASAHDGGCIKVFSGNGTLEQTIGSPGNGNEEFKNPWGLTILDNVLFVAEWGNNCVQKLSLDGKYIGQFGTNGSGQGQFNYPQGITHDCKGRILVADYGNKRVQVFDGSSCSFLKSIDCQGNNPSDVAVDNDGNIHVTYFNANCVAIFSPDGQQHITNYSNTNGHFQNPRAITIDEKGYRIVACYSNGSGDLHIIDTKGQPINRLGGFNNPLGVTTDQYGAIYAASFSNKCITKYV